mmetsp:Transcript_112776/g.273866  ORF Transcript_112776/g.273866 Transcript_112776/m.273866 type:complete len:834 (-) Transcript_112776:83-2584(-)
MLHHSIVVLSLTRQFLCLVGHSDHAGVALQSEPSFLAAMTTQRSSNKSSLLAPLPDSDLEKKLREWWGNVWFGEFQHLIDDDQRDLGYELSQGAVDGIQQVMWKVVQRHESGDPCSSLPLELSLHAWRYNQTDMDRCLSGSMGLGAPCIMQCAYLPSATAKLQCQKTETGWTLTGSPPESRCKWAFDEDVVNTTGGFVRGLVRPVPWKWADGRVSSERTRTFWGIPYADRPRRFELARPLSKRWSGVHFTDYYSIKQNASLRMHCAGAAPLDSGAGTEDCLFLDVYVPPNASAQSLRPVVALIFASGFALGDAWQSGHTEASRIALRDDVVFIVISARAAALGHWAHPALSAEYGDGSAGNIGERDQRMALQWIRANIQGFGGDPGKVTLLGHSSGAFDTAFHLASPGSRGLFAGAVLESATFDSAWYWQSKDQAFAFYAQLGEAMGCQEDGGTGSQIQCLRSLPADAFFNFSKAQSNITLERLKEKSYISDAWGLLKSLVAAGTGIGGGYKKAGLLNGDSQILASPLWPVLPFGLVVDGTDAGVPAPPRELYEAGRVADVPVYLNHEHDEGTIFAMMLAFEFPWQKTLQVTHSAVDAILDWAFGANATFTGELLQRYPHGTHLDAPIYRLSRVITDSVFLCSAHRFAEARGRWQPGRTFWGEHTFASSAVKSSSAVEALFQRDFAYFLGAHHCLPTLQIFGAEYQGSSGDWNDVDQRNHELMNCHFSLMFHCGAPGAEPGSACRRRMASNGVLPLACRGVPENAIYPFEAFDPARQQRNQISPTNHTAIVPSAEEREICRFWDSAPPMRLQPNSCRGCAQAAGLRPPSAVFV